MVFAVNADLALREIDRHVASDVILRDLDVREAHAGDGSEVPPHLPAAVLRPSSADDVVAILRAASTHRVPVTPRGGGTSRVGGAVPVAEGLVLAMDRIRGISGVERTDQLAVVRPGTLLAELHAAVEAEGLFYPPDPSSLDTCQIGGNIASNAGGPRAFKYGVTGDWVLGMEVVTGSGERLHVGRRTRKGVTGYDLNRLIVGSEGTLAVVTEATLRLAPKPPAIATLLVYLPGDEAVARAIDASLTRGITPRCVELLDGVALELVRQDTGLPMPDTARSLLLVELDGMPEDLDIAVERFGGAMDDAGAVEILVARSEAERARIWASRRAMSHALRRQARFKLSEDVAVPRSQIAPLLRRCRTLAETHGIVMPTYGHAGDGNLHVNLLWNDEAQRAAVDTAIRALFESVVAMGGTLSGEHGVGVLKAPYLSLEQPPALIAMQTRIKDAFDPAGILNPGKIFPESAKRFHGVC